MCTLGLGSAASGKTHKHKNKKQSLNRSGLFKMFISFSTTLGHPGGVLYQGLKDSSILLLYHSQQVGSILKFKP